MANILVINAGSSSIKYQVIDMTDESVIAKGIVERIGIPGSVLKHTATGKDTFVYEAEMNDHSAAMKVMLDALVDTNHGVFTSMDEIAAIGHRVVHGGEAYSDSVLVDKAAIEKIREYVELAPLHVPANIIGIEACMELMPEKPNVAVFDTAFHQTLPDYAYLYGIPYEVYQEHKVRRYGFHGTSHKYIAGRVAEMMGRDDLKIVTCHLGNGSSLAAVKNGESIDTTMGLTPLEGLVMGTRSGDIDPAAIPYLMKKLDMDVDETIDFLNKKSGVHGVSGISSDFRDLTDAYLNEGSARAETAFRVFSYRVKKYIGAYAAAMGGLDVIAFAGGVGENDYIVREFVTEGLEFLGVSIDKEANDSRGEKDITGKDSKVKVLVVATDEELMIARDTSQITGVI